MKLKRLSAGRYETHDGKYQIIKDPTSGGEKIGWGYCSWMIYRKGDIDPFWVCGDRIWPTLRDARLALMEHLL